jgi:opacity protein-like surface antigen
MFTRSIARTATAAFLACAVSLACVASARADANPTPRPGASLGGRAAYFWPAGSDAGSGQWMGGAQLRFYLANFFAVEGSADYRQQRFGGNTIADIYPVQVSGLLYLLPNSPVSPFALGGVGWYFTHVRGPSGFDQTSNRFGSHVGGGLQFFLSRHWSMDASYRYIFTDRITTTSNGVRVSVNGDGHMATGGINFHF